MNPQMKVDAMTVALLRSSFRRSCCAANALHFGDSARRQKSSADTVLATLTGHDLIEIARSWERLDPQIRESILMLVRVSVQKPSVQAGKQCVA